MSAELIIQQLRDARKFSVEVGHITFLCFCPTFSRVSAIITNAILKKAEDLSDAEIASISVIGWEGVTDADIRPGGDAGTLIPFDAKLFQELIFDRGDWWTPISMKVAESVQARKGVKEAEIKNSNAGTTIKPLKSSKVSKTKKA